MAGSPVARAAWRALASAFSMKVPCGSSASTTPSEPCVTNSSRKRRKERPVPRASSRCWRPAPASRPLQQARCRAQPSGPHQVGDAVAWPGRAGCPSRRAEERRAFGRALHLDETARARHHDVHVGVAGRVLVYSRSSSGVPSTMPTDTAATWSRSGRPPACPGPQPFTASWAATKAPVMAAVRVPPSACSTSQSNVMVRSPSACRSNTQRSERRSGAGSPACGRSACPGRLRGRCGCGWRAAACRTRP
jgi:hypothetical protein